MDRHVIIVAGGSGTRMGTNTPKQFLTLHQKPIIIHTIELFALNPVPYANIVVVSSQAYQSLMAETINKWLPQVQIQLTTGGNTRYESVKNGLQVLAEAKGLVAVHDAVRPFTSRQTIEACFESAAQYGSGVAAAPAKDTIRQGGVFHSKTLNRNEIYMIQTPQAFKLEQLRHAYAIVPDTPEITDDASVYERAGYTVCLVPSKHDNFKITTPEDLLLAEALYSLHRHQ